MKKPLKVVLIVCVVLCLALLGGCIANSFGAFDNVKIPEVTKEKVRNEQNILDPEFYKDRCSVDQKGVMLTTNKDGSITLNGKATGKSDVRIFSALDTSILGLTLSVGSVDFGEDAENTCLYLRHHTGDNEKYTHRFYSGESGSFTISYADGSNYNFYLSIAEGDEFDNVTIYPVLNYGVTAVSYFE